MRLFHFSEDGNIGTFVPRPAKTPSVRPAGMNWLNGPLVWAIDAWHQPMYLFPRDCPRILLWPLTATTPEDLQTYWTAPSCRMIAYVERSWSDTLSGAVLYRYALPGDAFESLNDAGMWVSRTAVTPTDVTRIDDLPQALSDADVELRTVPTLEPLKGLWQTSLHVSGIRLRNLNKGPFATGNQPGPSS